MAANCVLRRGWLFTEPSFSLQFDEDLLGKEELLLQELNSGLLERRLILVPVFEFRLSGAGCRLTDEVQTNFFKVKRLIFKKLSLIVIPF